MMSLLRKCAYRAIHISFESTQNKQQYGSINTSTEVRGGGGSYGDLKTHRISSNMAVSIPAQK